jgi:hypothetical protein
MQTEIEYKVDKMSVDTSMFSRIRDVNVHIRQPKGYEDKIEFYYAGTVRFKENEQPSLNGDLALLTEMYRVIGIYSDEKLTDEITSFDDLSDDIYVDVISIEDAANYIVGGCWDVITPELSNKFSGTYFFLLKPFEWLVSQDYENFEKRGLSCKGFENLPSFEKVYEAYMGYLKQLLLRRATLMAQGARVWSQVSPLCALSALMQPCIPNRLDVTAGGGKYNQESVYFSCFGDVGADRICAGVSSAKSDRGNGYHCRSVVDGTYESAIAHYH